MREQVIDLQEQGVAARLVVGKDLADDQDLVLGCLQLESGGMLQRLLDQLETQLGR